jgi:hypothetical protein
MGFKWRIFNEQRTKRNSFGHGILDPSLLDKSYTRICYITI